MKILFVSTTTYPPHDYNGQGRSTDQLCTGLIQRGHFVAVLTSISVQGNFGGSISIPVYAGQGLRGLFAWITLAKMKLNQKLIGHKIARDIGLGYPVWRTEFPLDEIFYIVSKEKPDVIVAVGGDVVAKTLAAKPTQLPVITQVHDVVFHLHIGDFKEIEGVLCVANSNFTADRYRNAHGIDCMVVYPFISLENYRTTTSRENVTFINPQLHKGVDIALKIARLCPDVPFSFVGVSPMADEPMKEIAVLHNVTLLPPQKDMRKVYGKCKILLAPSLCEEAYGRVVTEAQISGIPVIASDRGGLPEAVGPGGILVDPQGPVDDWVTAVRKLWQDGKYYDELSAAALAHAQRPEMSFAYQIAAHEKALLAAAAHN